MLVQPGLCRTCSETTLLVFPRGGLFFRSLHPWEPACAILSSAEDMAKWMKFHLSLGKTDSGVQLLKKNWVVEMHRVTSSVRGSYTKPRYPADDISIGYGYAWHISEYRGMAQNRIVTYIIEACRGG